MEAFPVGIIFRALSLVNNTLDGTKPKSRPRARERIGFFQTPFDLSLRCFPPLRLTSIALAGGLFAPGWSLAGFGQGLLRLVLLAPLGFLLY